MWLESEAIVAECFENEADVFLVLLEGALGVDNDVVEVGVAKDAKIRVKDRINEPLKDGGGGGEAHGHDGVLVGAKEGLKGGGFFGAGGHPEVGETGANIHRGDPIGTGEIVHERAGEGNRVFIEHNFTIKVSVVNDEAKLSGTAACGGVAYEEDRSGGLGF